MSLGKSVDLEYITHTPSPILTQAEYLHNTYNSMPNITVALDSIIHDSRVQWDVYNSSRAEVTSNIPIRPNKTMAVRQFEAMFMYTSALRRILVKMAENIKVSIFKKLEKI